MVENRDESLFEYIGLVRRVEPHVICIPPADGLVNENLGLIYVVVVGRKPQVHAFVEFIQPRGGSLRIGEATARVPMAYHNDSHFIEKIRVLISHSVMTEHK